MVTIARAWVIRSSSFHRVISESKEVGKRTGAAEDTRNTRRKRGTGVVDEREEKMVNAGVAWRPNVMEERSYTVTGLGRSPEEWGCVKQTHGRSMAGKEGLTVAGHMPSPSHSQLSKHSPAWQ